MVHPTQKFFLQKVFGIFPGPLKKNFSHLSWKLWKLETLLSLLSPCYPCCYLLSFKIFRKVVNVPTDQTCTTFLATLSSGWHVIIFSAMLSRCCLVLVINVLSFYRCCLALDNMLSKNVIQQHFQTTLPVVRQQGECISANIYNMSCNLGQKLWQFWGKMAQNVMLSRQF